MEKPFGHDFESAKKLITPLGSVFSEQRIYRIDHYLGKETVQNIMAFRLKLRVRAPVETEIILIMCRSPLRNNSAWVIAVDIMMKPEPLVI